MCIRDSFSTYYIPDSILIIGDKNDPEYWKDENAQIIINAFKTKMNAAEMCIRDSLNMFIAVVGISAGPSFVQGLKEVGPMLFIIAAPM